MENSKINLDTRGGMGGAILKLEIVNNAGDWFNLNVDEIRRPYCLRLPKAVFPTEYIGEKRIAFDGEVIGGEVKKPAGEKAEIESLASACRRQGYMYIEPGHKYTGTFDFPRRWNNIVIGNYGDYRRPRLDFMLYSYYLNGEHIGDFRPLDAHFCKILIVHRCPKRLSVFKHMDEVEKALPFICTSNIVGRIRM